MAMLPRWVTERAFVAALAASLLALPAPAQPGPGSVSLEALAQRPAKERALLLSERLAQDPESSGAPDLRLLLGRALLDDGWPAEAARALAHPSLDGHPLREWALRWRLEALPATADRRAEREPLLQALLEAGGEPSFRLEAARELADLRLAAKRHRDAVAPLEALLKAAPLDAATAASLAAAAARAGLEPRARELALWLYTEMPAREESRAFFRDDPARLAWVTPLAPDRRLRRLLRLDAAGALSDLASTLPEAEAGSPEERLWRPYFETRLAAGKTGPAAALRAFLALSSPPEVRQAALRQVPGLLTTPGLPRKEFERGVRALVEEMADPAERERAFLSLHRWCLKQGDESGASYFALKALRSEGGSTAAPEYLYRTAWEAYLSGRATRAQGLWGDLASALPPQNEYHQSALYTLLLTGSLSDEKAAAAREELLQSSRYGYFGYQLREGLPPVPVASPVALPAPPADPVPSGGHRDKAARLADLALFKEAAAELAQVLPEAPTPAHHWELSQLKARAGDFPGAVTSARKAFPDAYGAGGDALPPEAWRALYPLPYPEALEKASEATDLATELLAAVTRQESLWDRTVVSRAGAVGLMQLLPSTAREVARREGMLAPTEQRLRDPEWNVAAGARYLKRMLERCGGSLPIALASYNAGPGNADKWRARPNNPADPRLFTESVPFRETRLYIRRITLYRQEYARIYPERAARPPAGGVQASAATP